MKAAVVTRPGKLEVMSVPEPRISDYQAKCRTLCCGVCGGTDSKVIAGKIAGFNTYPAILGHEAIGEVIELGDKVETFSVGDRVTRAGLFEVLEGGFTPGWGGFSECTVVADYTALKRDTAGPVDVTYVSMQTLPDWMPAKHGPVLILLKEVLAAFNRLGLRNNADVAVFGAGPVGVTFVRLAKLFGARRVAAVSRTQAKLERAQHMGADLVVNAGESDPLPALRDFVSDGYDYLIDAAGAPDIIRTCLKLVKMDGTICSYGLCDNPEITMDWTTAPERWHLQVYNDPAFEEEAAAHDHACNLISTGVLDPAWYIDAIFPFDKIKAAFEQIRTKKAFKAVVEF